MRITALVENKSACELKPKHGLSLYIETKRHKILFDLGPDNTLIENSKMKHIDLRGIDTVVISHGHTDHGGALAAFLQINKTAKVYVQRRAFEKHYGKYLFFKVNIGLDPKLKNHPQVVLADGDFQIDDELALFTVKNASECCSSANDTLYAAKGRDDFSHEQNLLIRGEHNVLILGCGHTGIVNIMQRAAEHHPKVCVGGFHLFNPSTKKTVSYKLLDSISERIRAYDTTFYTCHCTGIEAFRYLSERVDNIVYLSCGETIEA